MRGTCFQNIAKHLFGIGRLLFCILTSLAVVLAGIAPPANKPNRAEGSVADSPQVCIEYPEHTLGAAGNPNLFWKGKHKLLVLCLGGSEFQHNKVRQYAPTWNPYTGIPFVFVTEGQADIRVSFKPGRSWSYIGSSATRKPDTEATMNLGWIGEATDEAVIRGTILHEFGHALGLIHEHQSPAAGIPWNKDEVYDYYWDNYGWNKKRVDDNILNKYKATQTQFTAYDSNSIMQYPIDRRLTTNGFSVPWHDRLSQIDIDFVRANIRYVPK